MGKHVYMKIGIESSPYILFFLKKKEIVFVRKGLRWLLCAGQPDFLLMDELCPYVKT